MIAIPLNGIKDPKYFPKPLCDLLETQPKIMSMRSEIKSGFHNDTWAVENADVNSVKSEISFRDKSELAPASELQDSLRTFAVAQKPIVKTPLDEDEA